MVAGDMCETSLLSDNRGTRLTRSKYTTPPGNESGRKAEGSTRCDAHRAHHDQGTAAPGGVSCSQRHHQRLAVCALREACDLACGKS